MCLWLEKNTWQKSNNITTGTALLTILIAPFLTMEIKWWFEKWDDSWIIHISTWYIYHLRTNDIETEQY